MADIVPLTNLRGPAARIIDVTVETLPADQPAEVEMTGPDQGRAFHFKTPRGLPGVNAVENDEAVATYLGASDSDTNAAVRAVIGSHAFVIDSDYASLELALAAVAVGGTLEVRTAWTRAATFTVNKACTIRFARAGSITVSSASIAAMTVTASDVTIESAVIVGTGGSTAGSGKGILAVGTLAVPIRRLRIMKPRISEISEYGIYLEFCNDFRVDQPAISAIAYAGIATASCVTGVIDGGTVTNIIQPTGLLNSYGITISRRTNHAGELTTYPRSRDITVSNVTIDGVLLWEGLDTHAGQDLKFIGNIVRNCLVGIAVVPSSNNAGVATYAPLNVKVQSNIIQGAGDGTNSAGLWFTGTAVEQATGEVVTNRIVDTGGDTSTPGNNWGGIVIERTTSLIVANNSLIRCAVAGIHLILGNVGTTLAGNTVEDVWSNTSGICAAVYVRSNPNTVSVTGTTIVRGAKTATRVNNEGIRCSTSSTQTDGGANQWSLATTPVVGSAALKWAVFGAVPVERAAAIASPSADAASEKVAIDAIRTVLKNAGLTF
ncbi:hypothetical protein [Microbacterium sp. K24]|uniref:hypothetical protein n=1 Tax=Microbacterium sp. K24 TaxID=2305446 RepID=UPI00109CC68A|nr:hypothetical protein [Microbacterium sp. K24]